MHVPGRHDFAFQDVAEHEVIVHCLSYNSGDGGRGEFDEGVVFGVAGGAVAREAKAGYVSELAKVGTHLGFVEAVRDASDELVFG